jgi:hypothetical protein
MPEYFLSLFVCGSGWLMTYATVEKDNWQWKINTSLLASVITGTAALICFNTHGVPQLYIWLPLYFFLTPCLAYTISRLYLKFSPLFIKCAILIMALLIIVIQTPKAVLASQYQFSMDALLQDLVTELDTNLNKSKVPVTTAFPVFEQSAGEVSLHIKFFVNSKHNPLYFIKPVEEESPNQKFTMLSFLTKKLDPIEFAGDGNRAYKLPGGQTYTSSCDSNYIGYSGFQYVYMPNKDLIKRPLEKGAWLLVPYGDLSKSMPYRGIGLFTTSAEDKLNLLPELEFECIGAVERKVTDIFGHQEKLGWKIFKIIQRYPYFSETLGKFVFSSDRLYFDFVPEKPTLCLTTKHHTPKFLTVTGPTGKVEIALPKKRGEITTFEVNTSAEANNMRHFLCLNWEPVSEFLRIDSGYLSEPLKPDRNFELRAAADGWIENHSTIVYPPDLTGKSLVLRTTFPCAKTLILHGRNLNRVIDIQNKKEITLKLVDGTVTTDGRFCLAISAPEYVKVNGDPRQLIYHVEQNDYNVIR